MDSIEEIKSRIDIVDFISQYLPLKKSGSNFRALCPFHAEKTPSFFVSPEKQIWHCFGCGKGGNIFNFLMEMEKIEFPEALQILAEKAGVKLQKYNESQKNLKTQLYKINKIASLFYHKILLEHPLGKKALSYLLNERKLPLSIIEKFQLGYAPGKDILLQFLKKKGFEEEEIINSGLTLRTENGKLQDLFFERVVFPFKDSLGRVLGFTGRALGSGIEPKYLNTPQTLIFDKGKILYGIYEAKEAIKKLGSVIVCEGQMDVLAFHKIGVENVVCASGTAFTENQLNLLKKFTKKIIFSFDTDDAGQEALLRSVGEALDKDFAVRVILIKDGKDPDEIIKRNPDEFKKLIEEPVEFLDFFFKSISAKINISTSEGKTEVLEKIFPIVLKIKNKIEQHYWLSKIAFYLNLEDKIIFDAFNTFKNKETKERKIEEFIDFSIPSKNDLIESQFLGMIFAFPENLSYFIIRVFPEDFSNFHFSNVWKKLQEFYTLSEEEINLDDFLASLGKDVREKIEELIFAAQEFFKYNDENKIFQETLTYFKRLKKIKFEKIKKEISEEIKKAEKEKDSERIKNLLSKFQKIILKEKRELEEE